MKCSVLIRQVRFVVAMRAWIVALALVLPSFATAQSLTYLVGGDAVCDFTTIQAAINAAAAHPGPDFIHVAMNATYTAQAPTIGSQDLEIDGGFATCSSATATNRTTISGTGNGNHSVFRITGSGGRVLRHLVISGGDAPFDGNGGGINYTGSGEVNLGDVIVSGNYAGYGGGINAGSSGGPALLTLEANVVVINNTAQFSGGGIRIDGDSRLVMLADGIAVTGNEAIGIDPANNQPKFGNGGGVEVVGPASADIGSPGAGNSGVIYANTARNGGGIAIAAPDTSFDSIARVRLFSTDATRPVRVHDNRATQAGGGVYVLPNQGLDNTSHAVLCAFDFRIEDNRAPQGSGIYADTSSDALGETLGGEVGMNLPNDDPQYDFFCAGGPALPTLGAVACAQGTPCNTISSNVAEDENGNPTAGAAILIETEGTLTAHRVMIANNVGSQALRLIAGGSFGIDVALLFDCLIADNAVTGELIRMEGVATGVISLGLDNCTLANNTIGAANVLSASSSFALKRSVLWQPGKQSLQQSGGSRDVSDVVTSEKFSLDGGSVDSVIQADPRFIDPAHADYHLQAASPAVDFAAPIVGDQRDLDNLPRDQDLVVPDRFGDRDLGAYERQTLLPLVLNKDFDTDLRLWSVVIPGSATWNSANAPGSSGGSVLVSVSPPVVGDVVGLSQCVHIPAPGDYQLTGSGYGGGFGVTRDNARLHWKYRVNPGGETCSGSTAAEGDLGLPGSSTWGTPLVPALISVAQNEWTRNSSVEVTLVVHENGLSVVGATVGHFDNIRLEPALDDVIFADGFDGP